MSAKKTAKNKDKKYPRSDLVNFAMRRGFTLVETIVSIGLLTLVLGALVSSVTTSLKLAESGNKKYIASKIAQEGMELFQSKRNNNVMCIENDDTTPCSIPDAAYLGGEKDWRYRLYTPLPPVNPDALRPPKSYEIDGNVPNLLLVGSTLANYNSTHYLCQQSTLSGRYSYCGVASQYIPGNFTREIRVSVDTTVPTNVPTTNIYSPLKVEVIVSWSPRTGARQSLRIEKHFFYTQP